MNLCLIYLTEWVREVCDLMACPQRWIMGGTVIDQSEVTYVYHRPMIVRGEHD